MILHDLRATARGNFGFSSWLVWSITPCGAAIVSGGKRWIICASRLASSVASAVRSPMPDAGYVPRGQFVHSSDQVISDGDHGLSGRFAVHPQRSYA